MNLVTIQQRITDLHNTILLCIDNFTIPYFLDQLEWFTDNDRIMALHFISEKKQSIPLERSFKQQKEYDVYTLIERHIYQPNISDTIKVNTMYSQKLVDVKPNNLKDVLEQLDNLKLYVKKQNEKIKKMQDEQFAIIEQIQALVKAEVNRR